MLYIPDELNTLMVSKGQTGKQWLDELPAAIETLETRWNIKVTKAFPNCYCNYVAEATTEVGNTVVLKMGFPDDEFIREVAYLQQHQGGPVPRITNVDMSLYAVLMEKIEPAKTLVTVQSENEAIAIAATLMKKLWQPIPNEHSFKHTDKQYTELVRLGNSSKAKDVLPLKLIEQAKQIYEFLKSTRQEEVLLHGDLHHYNIIFDQERGWVAIDPVGLVGERGYDLTAFLKNPPDIGHADDLRNILVNRITQFSSLLDLEPRRVLLWGQFQSVLATLWADEDGTNIVNSFAKVAITLSEVEL